MASLIRIVLIRLKKYCRNDDTAYSDAIRFKSGRRSFVEPDMPTFDQILASKTLEESQLCGGPTQRHSVVPFFIIHALHPSSLSVHTNRTNVA